VSEFFFSGLGYGSLVCYLASAFRLLILISQALLFGAFFMFPLRSSIVRRFLEILYSLPQGVGGLFGSMYVTFEKSKPCQIELVRNPYYVRMPWRLQFVLCPYRYPVLKEVCISVQNLVLQSHHLKARSKTDKLDMPKINHQNRITPILQLVLNKWP
jgi:hypothetical protein